MARLAPGVSLAVARQRSGALAARLEEAYPDTNARVGVSIYELREDLARSSERALWVLLGAVGFVLLIACTNVANLLVVRGASRGAEFSLRLALGAGRAPILRQLLVESTVLASLGGLLGLGLAAWGTGGLLALVPAASLHAVGGMGVDGRVLGFTAALSLGTGVLFGFVPAARASAADVYRRVGASTTPAARFASRVRGLLVVAQVALALVLLIGAGLLIRSFQRLHSAELGFEPDGVLTVSLALPGSRYADGAERVTYYRALLERLREIPGVLSASSTSSIPLAGDDAEVEFRVEGRPPPERGVPDVTWVRRVTRGYFYTMGIDLREGRPFEESDDAQAPRVVAVNESLARQYLGYPRRSAVGARVAVGARGEPVWWTVVGVVGDTRHSSVRDEARPALYLPYEQLPTSAMTLVLRTAGDPLEVAADARAAVSAVDPALAASRITPLVDLVDRNLVADRFVTGLLGLFSLVALLLAAVGLYGVVSHGVTRRLREMGIRLALGAASGDVQRLVLVGGFGLALVGIALGVLGALAVTGVLEALLYEVTATDPATFAGTVALLTGVALLATWVPARRAAAADPVEVLRHE